MTVTPAVTHPWDVAPVQAIEIQKALRSRVLVKPLDDQPHIVAGVDVSAKRGHARAAVVLLSWPDLEPLGAVTAERRATFPYVPGLLAFREGPVVLEALADTVAPPDVLIFDAHGLAHPRRMGLATHLGVLLDLPTIGCAKTCLCGDYREPDVRRGSWTVLRHRGEVVGAVLRTRDNVRPVFVSIGHRIDLETAVSIVLDGAPRYRLPETTRWARRVAGGWPIREASQLDPVDR